MIKAYKIKAQMNLDASDIKEIIIKANSERNAKIKAINEFKNNENDYIKIINITQII